MYQKKNVNLNHPCTGVNQELNAPPPPKFQYYKVQNFEDSVIKTQKEQESQISRDEKIAVEHLLEKVCLGIKQNLALKKSIVASRLHGRKNQKELAKQVQGLQLCCRFK